MEENKHLTQSFLTPDFYPHETKNIEVIKTTISIVFLTGNFAYKIKKNVNLGYVDFSSLDKRKYFYEQEIKLNAKMAKSLYIGIIPIYGPIDSPSLENNGNPIIEYAIKMHQFNQEDLLTSKPVELNTLKKISNLVANYHLYLEPTYDPNFGSLESILNSSTDNFKDIKKIGKHNSEQKQKIEIIEKWNIETFNKLKGIFEQRKNDGFIKNCHGDLHLGNIAILNDEIITFDCIEFNPVFSNIDTIHDISLLLADLIHNQQIENASIFLDQYLQQTNDYQGLQILTFYIAYKMAVRCKVLLLNESNDNRYRDSNLWIETIYNFIHAKSKYLIIMHGVSGSGKSHIANSLAPKIHGLVLRADNIRKLQNETDKYTEENINANYEKMAEYAEYILQSNHNAIIDATFLKEEHRNLFEALAKKYKKEFYILCPKVDISTLEKRISNSERFNSDADIKVAKMQLDNYQPPRKSKKVIEVDNKNFNIEKILSILS